MNFRKRVPDPREKSELTYHERALESGLRTLTLKKNNQVQSMLRFPEPE